MKDLTAVALFIGLLAIINEVMCDVGQFNNSVVASAARRSLTVCLAAIGTK